MVLTILPQFQEEVDQNREERLVLVFEARVVVEEGRRAKVATVSDDNVFNTIYGMIYDIFIIYVGL